MSTARPAESSSAPALAAAIREARFVRLFAAADGDALAASGLLARASRATGVPFQVRASDRPPQTDGDAVTIAVGSAAAAATDAELTLLRSETPASLTAFEAATELDAGPDPVLALAGIVAAGHRPTAGDAEQLLSRASGDGRAERRPGVAVPTADLADGLAHTTLLHASFSGDPDAVRARLADLGDEAETGRAVASMVAIDVAGATATTPRGARTVEQALRPYATPDGPFETLGGFADVLDVVARERPGTAVALALGHDAAEAALDAWRRHAAAAHETVRSATTARYDGTFVARVTGEPDPKRLVTAARLVRDYRSPEPVALVVGDGVAGVATAGPAALAAALDAGVAATERESSADDDPETGTSDDAHEATVRADDRYGHARFDGDPSAFVAGFREAA
jgi:hypothetical protein